MVSRVVSPILGGMLVVTRYRMDPEQSADWIARAQIALAALAARPGFVRGWVGRASDDVSLHTLSIEFDSVGSARRALSNHEVRYAAWELLGGAIDEPTSYEVLVSHDADGNVRVDRSAVAVDADTVGLGQAAGPEVGSA
jgi:heme oxygenase (mycobilin-producing)